MQHYVRIRWGDHLPEEEKPEERYQFNSKEELDAFMQGVEEASGWLAHLVLEDSRDLQNPEEPLQL